MNVKQLTPDLFVCGQLRPADMPVLAENGVKSIIINRPTGEGPGQPGHDDITQAASAASIEVRYIPVKPGQITPGHVEAFDKALEELPSPTVAFCKTGMRAASLWALSQAGKQSADDIMNAAGDCGYDLSKLEAYLRAQG